MPVVSAFLVGLVGVFAGMHLKVVVLIVLTSISVMIAADNHRRMKEIAVLIALVYDSFAAIFNLCMWTSYFIMNPPYSVITFFKTQILQ